MLVRIQQVSENLADTIWSSAKVLTNGSRPAFLQNGLHQTNPQQIAALTFFFKAAS